MRLLKVRKKNKVENRKTIAVLFRYTHPIIGMNDIFQRIDELIKHYNILIITNDKRIFLRKDNLNIIEIINSKILGHKFFILRSRLKLLFIKYDAIFLTAIQFTPIMNMYINKPVICYGNVNPLQICNIKKLEEIKYFRNLSLVNLKKIIKLKYIYYCLKKCSKVFAISQTLIKDFKNNGVSESKIELIYMGVDTDIFKKDIKKIKKFTIIYPGSISEERGLDVILNSLRIINKRIRFQFIFVGCQKEMQLKIMKEMKDMKEEVKCLPILPIKKTATLISKSGIGISLLENNDYFKTSPPTKLFEYMSSGIGIIANDIETHTEYIKNEYNGIIIKNNSEELSEAIIKLYNNKNLLIKISENAYLESHKYDWKSQKSKFIEKFYETFEGNDYF